MINVFEAYGHLWPKDKAYQIKALLSPIYCFHFPEDLQLKQKDLDKKNTVVIYKEKNKNIVSFLVNGFDHIICLDREDFPQQLLASAVMIQRPRPFIINPLPFFFNEFKPDASTYVRADNNLTISFQSTSQKDEVFDLLKNFWRQKSSMEALEDICLQIVDEMFTNVFFNAPIEGDGKRPFKEVTRESHILLPEKFKPKIFTCFSHQKVLVGCEDSFGSIVREPIMYRLESLYTEAMTGPREHTAGAGLGFKFLIDNSSNFYVYSDKGKRTIFACGLILKGLKANMMANKNIHFAVT
jgi:hypothetical protein